MTIQSDNKAIYQTLFKQYIERLQMQQRTDQGLEWCLDKTPFAPFKPDYLTFRLFGRTWIQRKLNLALSYVPYLWNKFIWPRFYLAFIERIDQKYMFQIYKSCNFDQNIKANGEIFLAILIEILKNPPNCIQFSTYTDMFYFLTECLNAFCDSCGISFDVYKQEKDIQNNQCLKIYSEIRDELLKHERRLDIAIYLAIRANWIDSVEDTVDAFLQFFLEEVNLYLDNEEIAVDSTYYQIERVKAFLTEKPKVILYELDNSGEVIIDLLLIEMLLRLGHKIVMCAKKQPVLNDVTISDLQLLLKDKRLSHLQEKMKAKKLFLIHANSGIAGKYLFDVSDDYKAVYKKAHLLILKGQGNFQNMPMGYLDQGVFKPHQYKKPILFMMGIKADLIVDCFGMFKGLAQVPEKQSLFLKYFNAKQTETYLS